MVTIKHEDLVLAFEFASSGGPLENIAYVSLDTGAIYYVSQTDPIKEREAPDDLETSDRYVAIPHKNDLDLGVKLVLRFVEERLVDRYADVQALFRRRGAYARFKELLVEAGCLEEWYLYENEASERELREWCKENEIEVVDAKKT